MTPVSFATVLKWVGYATAILSLIAGVRGLSKVYSDRVETRRKVEALLASEQIQAQGHDYRSAWQTLEQAAQADPKSAAVRDAQETLAMDWLENIRVGENERFSDIAAKLDPVLTRGVAAKKGPRQADLLAHLGWSYFLRSREGAAGLDPAATYAEATKKDPNNPYAQAMWGHWILWNHGDAAEASRHFAAALSSNRERGYVRGLELSALLNLHNEQGDEEIVRVVNGIRKEQGSVDPEMKHQIFNLYDFEVLASNGGNARFLNAVPAAEHVATFRWLFDSLDPNGSEGLRRTSYLSVLEEAAGQRTEALAGFESVRRQLAGRPGTLLSMVEAGSKRLSRSGRNLDAQLTPDRSRY
jgi:tetratricopeptide (TPR) repeat protein